MDDLSSDYLQQLLKAPRAKQAKQINMVVLSAKADATTTPLAGLLRGSVGGAHS